MTFNVKQQNPKNKTDPDSPSSWSSRKPLVIEIITDASPDFIGLQEPYRHQMDDLRKVFPKFDEIGEGRDRYRSDIGQSCRLDRP